MKLVQYALSLMRLTEYVCVCPCSYSNGRVAGLIHLTNLFSPKDSACNPPLRNKQCSFSHGLSGCLDLCWTVILKNSINWLINQLIDTSIWYYTLRPENSSSYLFFEGVIHYRFKQYRKRTLRRTNQSFLAGPNGPGRRNCGRGRDLMSSISCGVATQVETVEAAGAGKWKCVILEEPNVPKWTALYRK